jgi:hypothetical protein
MMQHKENWVSLYQKFVRAFKMYMLKHSNNVDTNRFADTMLFL